MSILNKNIFFILQIRTGSTRLPGKMLMPFFNGKTIPEIIIDRLIINGVATENIVIATTNSSQDDKLVELLKHKECKIYRGDENNVLKRFIDAATQFKTEFFFRICADNPFLNFKYIAEIIKSIDLGKTDYASHYLENNIPAIKTHFGLFCEYTNLKTLKIIAALTNSTTDLEHVTPFIYEHAELFNIQKLQIPDLLTKNKWLRLTIDTQEDFEMAQTVYKKSNSPENIEALIQTAKSEGFKEMMQKAIEQQSK